jgi:2-polyprenyl-3-methyl-5-hydroxy-6-metoxy-1,4-benzoquinol methylase
MYYRQRDDKTRAVSFMISHLHEDEKKRQRELFEGPLFTPILERQLAADAFGLSLCLTWMAAKEHRLLHNVYTQMRGLVLDLGCGTGRRLNRLAAEWNIHGIGLDIALRQLRENTLHNPFHHFYINGDVEKTPFRSESFELVICTDVLEHVPSPERCILETARLLSPEGIAFFYTNSSRQEGTLPDILRRLTRGKLGSDHGHAGEHHPEMFLSPEQFVCLCRNADLEVMEPRILHILCRLTHDGYLDCCKTFRKVRALS